MKERRLWGRWPQGFRPLHYELSLAFTFDVEGHLLSDYYEGSVSIAVGGMVGRHLSLDWAQQEGRQLKFVRVDGIPAQVTTELDTQDTCVLETEVEMQDTCVIEIEFTGIISHSADTGLYVCSCDGFPLVATHLEPGYAHHVFPCFDSPRYRPRISLTLIGIPDSLSAFSNSSCGERIATSSGSQTRFHCTQEMPIYLFGFWIGPFTVLQKSLEPPLPQTVSAVVPAGQRVEEAQFGLNLACRALGFFHNLLGCAVPITKLDIICVPRLHGMAMEGFGAITVLCDFFLVNAATPVARKRRVARLICHEILHQWIGDHVSCRSFDDLWLKEGLARLFEFDAVEVLCPEHAIWANFIEDVVFQAQLHDAWTTANAHAVVQHHNGVLKSIITSFDHITYGKAACILRMLRLYMGHDCFMKGIRLFIELNENSAVDRDALVVALQRAFDETACPRPCEEKISTVLHSWLHTDRFPQVCVSLNDDGARRTLVLKQHPFLPGLAALKHQTGGVKRELNRETTLWHIPLILRMGNFPESETEGERPVIISCIMKDEMVTIELPDCLKRGRLWLVVNTQHAGFWTTIYAEEASWSAVLASLAAEHMTELEEMGLVFDLILELRESVHKGNGSIPRQRLNDVVVLLETRPGVHPAWFVGKKGLWEYALAKASRCPDKAGRDRLRNTIDDVLHEIARECETNVVNAPAGCNDQARREQHDRLVTLHDYFKKIWLTL